VAQWLAGKFGNTVIKTTLGTVQQSKRSNSTKKLSETFFGKGFLVLGLDQKGVCRTGRPKNDLAVYLSILFLFYRGLEFMDYLDCPTDTSYCSALRLTAFSYTYV